MHARVVTLAFASVVVLGPSPSAVAAPKSAKPTATAPTSTPSTAGTATPATDPTTAGPAPSTQPTATKKRFKKKVGTASQSTTLTKLRRAISGWWDEQVSVPWSEYPGKALLRLPIPPGSWVINAKAVVHAHIDTHGVVGCRLIAGADSDKSTVIFLDPEDNSSPLSNFNGQVLSLQVVHTFTSNSSVLFQCWGKTKKSDVYSYEDGYRKLSHVGEKMPVWVEDVKITAVEVDSLTNKPLKLIE